MKERDEGEKQDKDQPYFVGIYYMIYKITAGGCLHYDLNTFKVNWYLQETLQVLLMKVVCKKVQGGL